MHAALSAAMDSHGLMMRADAIALGATDRDLNSAVRRRLLHRVRAGTYVATDLWEALEPRERHLLMARGVLRKVGASVAASHVTAAVLHGAPLWELPLEEVHLTRLDGASGRRESGRAMHRGELRPEDLQTVDGLLVTTPARTAVDLASIVDSEHLLPVVDDFLRRELTAKAAIAEASRFARQWPGTAGADFVLSMADARHESVGESRTDHLMFVHQLPRPVPQYAVFDETGRLLARLDFAWPDLKVWLEFDGAQKYGKLARPGEDVTAVVLREKRREEQIARLTGWRCIRITWADLYRPHATAAYIRSVLAGGPVHI